MGNGRLTRIDVRGVEKMTNLNGRLIINHAQDDEDNLVLLLAGDLDISTAPQLKSFIERVIKDGPVKMRLDLSQLSYLDSSGYSALINARKQTEGAKCHFDLTNMPPWMTDFFDLSALEA
jgi:anti-anti-sigma factor